MKVRQGLAEGIDVVAVAGHARHQIGVPGLHRAGGTPQRDHARCAAKRPVIKPPRRQAEMLGEADSRVGRDRELDTDRPSMSCARTPARLTSSRSARPIHQWAVLVE